MGAAEVGGALVSREKVRTAHVRMRRNFYSDSTARRLAPM